MNKRKKGEFVIIIKGVNTTTYIRFMIYVSLHRSALPFAATVAPTNLDGSYSLIVLSVVCRMSRLINVYPVFVLSRTRIRDSYP